MKCLLLKNDLIVISDIVEIGSELGEPDCKLINPFVIKDDLVLEPWLLKITKDDIFMLSSDKILTLVDPTPTLLEKYQDLIKPTVINPTIV